MLQLLKNYFWHLPKAIILSARYWWPARKLTIIGVTGTKGKTTTAHMIYHLLRRMKGSDLLKRSDPMGSAGLISTIGAFFSNEEIDTGLHVTNPDPRELQKLLRMAVEKGLTHMVLEVTSNGLDQFRVWGIKFAVGVITNVTPDHLDYHKTFDKYFEAKSKLVRQSATIVLNDCSGSFAKLKDLAEHLGKKVICINGSNKSFISQNQEMALAAVKSLSTKDTPWRTPRSILFGSFPGVPGRMETVYDKDFKIVIDFAHTPESLTAALRELRKSVKKSGRLIAVFGCAGERDHGRRRMGEVAAQLADFFVITAEDPRTESAEEISREIAEFAINAGAKETTAGSLTHQPINPLTHIFARIPDRQEAINQAILLAKSGDVIGLFGKGHEKSMCYGKTELPWSEHEAVKKALKFIRKQ